MVMFAATVNTLKLVCNNSVILVSYFKVSFIELTNFNPQHCST